MGELVTAEEIAESVRVAPDTVKLWTREGLIPAVRINSRTIRYDPADVFAALKKRSQEGGAS